MKTFDYYFHYKYVLRFLLIQKCGLNYKNIYLIPKLYKLNTFFVIKNLIEFDDLRCSNYYFFFKHFFGRKANFVNYNSKFSLNVLYHSFNIQLIIVKQDIYFFINFLFNDILPYCQQRYNVLRFKNYITYVILDMNIFLEKKTHIGFFNLKNSLNMQFFCNGNKLEKLKLLILLKFKI